MNRLFLTLVPAAIAVSIAAPPAHAQFGGRTAVAQAFDPDVWQRDIPIFVETLELEEWQRPILEMLVEDYLASFHAGVDTVRQRMVTVQSGEKPTIQSVLAPIEQWNSEKKALYGRFLESVRSQLSPQQMQRWPALERAMRRERLLPQGELSGEGLNLGGVLRDLAAPPEVMLAAAPALEAHEIRLDAALLNRQSRMEEILPSLKDAMAEMDHDRGLQLQDRIMAARVQLRDAQEQGIMEIAEAMGPDWGSKFRTLAMQRAFPEAYQPSTVMRLYDAALAMSDLSDEQRTTITNLKEQFQHELDLIREQMVSAIRTQEPREPRRRVERARERREGSAPAAGQDRAEPGSIEYVRSVRAQTEEKYRKLLEDTLTQEQLASLPGAGVKPNAVPVRATGPVQQRDSPFAPGARSIERRGAGRSDSPGLGTTGGSTRDPSEIQRIAE